jgi:hypothetical protein
MVRALTAFTNRKSPLILGLLVSRAEQEGLSEGLLSGFSRASFFFLLGSHPECCPPSSFGLDAPNLKFGLCMQLWTLEGLVEGP